MDIKLRLEKITYFLMAMCFFGTAAVTCGGAMTTFLILWPFNKPLYRKLVPYLAYTLSAQLVFWLRYWATTDFKLYVDKEVYAKFLGKEHSLCVMNHSGELDWMVLPSLLDHLNILGNFKAYIKNAMKYLPFVGWGFYCYGFIPLSRSYEKDKIILNKSAHDLSQYVEPVSILLFPEGTRFSGKKHKEALKFSRERGLKELRHHLVPRTKGFTTSVPLMKGKIPAVYDIELAFDGVKPTFVNVAKGRHFNVHMYLRRIQMEQLPDTEKELDLFLRDMFYRKDELMESFLKTGDFFKLTNQEPLEPITIEPNVNCFYNMIFWFIVTSSPIMYFFINLLLNGQFFTLVIIIICIVFSVLVLQNMFDNLVQVQESNPEIGDKIKQS